MKTSEKIIYWLSIAEYDLITAEAMLKTKRFLYVGFLCHQVAEKSLKAYYWYIQKNEPPYTHNLLVLFDKSELNKIADKERQMLLNELMPLNIQARYPDDKELLLKALTQKKSTEFYNRTKEFYVWIKQLLK